MSKKTDNAQTIATHENGFKVVKNNTQATLHRLITNLKGPADLKSVNNIIQSSGNILGHCEKRLRSGQLSGVYSHEETWDQIAEINVMRSQLKEHAYKATTRANELGFAYFC